MNLPSPILAPMADIAKTAIFVRERVINGHNIQGDQASMGRGSSNQKMEPPPSRG